MTALAASRPALDLHRFDRRGLRVAAGARVALAVAVAITAGALSHHLGGAIEAAIGAIIAGMSSLEGAYRSRIVTMVVGAIVFAASATVGATLGHVLVAEMAILAIWGLAAGWAVALGPAAGVIGLEAVLGVVLFADQHLALGPALVAGWWTLAGGLGELLLVGFALPFVRSPMERTAAATLLAERASTLRAIGSAPPSVLDLEGSETLRQALREPQPFSDPAILDALRSIADEAERIRLEAAAIATARTHVQVALDDDVPDARIVADAIDTALTALADGLDVLARRLMTQRHHEPPPTIARILGVALWTLERAGDDHGALGEGAREATVAIENLAASLRSLDHLGAVVLGRAAPMRRADGTNLRVEGELRASLHDAMATLRRSLAPSSEVGHHGARVAATLVVAVALAASLPVAHRYWLPLTVIFVLRPDFTTTLRRAFARSMGTVIGVGLVTALLALTHPSTVTLAAASVALAGLAIATQRANYLLFSFAVSSLVVVLLAFTGAPALGLAIDRSVYTVLGSLLAVMAVIAWPSWERGRVGERLATLLEADAQHAALLGSAWESGTPTARVAVTDARRRARLARQRAEASVSRWLDEPRHSGSDPVNDDERVLGVLAAVRRYVWSALVLDRLLDLERTTPAPSVPLGRLGNDLADLLQSCAAAARGDRFAVDVARARTTQIELATALLASESSAPHVSERNRVIMRETDRMVAAATTIAHLLAVSTRPRDREGPEDRGLAHDAR
ncbi:protein of unknown function DUF893 YccS/YhfK [Acidimicrobium ferrooxidans DSM 10331]|uniref:Integral membrane bound transporter domain-containing protein n=1 Tax=Acidimicrobium ferrooxidans (strain DSM 10331 / JCM 15462 / NBRC 103882 / ICP) TaxID=525909 RepID=C7M2K9_ACIFD|nr:FUSC family protein [Acidimicrobium ferrooxidans]ACU53253.1 protein of unknown function DUF893 YccS/YhfK [Acidimicrobium ferrooxidans DSM 10331]